MSLFGGLKRAQSSTPVTGALPSFVPVPPRPVLPRPAARSHPEAARSWDELGAEGQAAFRRWLTDEQRPDAAADEQP